MKTPVRFSSFALLLLWCGCAGSEPSIFGTVKLDGQPLADGDIRFIPMEDTTGGDAGAVIRDGKFKVAAHGLAGGKYRISIRGYQQGGRMEPDPLGGLPIKGTVQIVPEEYNGEKSKVVKVINRGANRLDLDLRTSQAAK